MSLIGNRSPEWSGPAYVRGKQCVLSSKDYEGKWHVLYWYPLDFTWVCPTEIRGFQALLNEFTNDGVEVVGASTDSFYTHKTWFQDRNIFPQEITHPVLADRNLAISRAFDVLKESAGVAWRATIVVDDAGIVHAAHTNDLQVGRSPAEVLRTVQALQSGGYCAANWNKGDAFAQ
ncbi:peroxiredoxin [Burkholderia cepacia]|uniref:peroxiredoxin n=1 Tax=Burkholderia cepacia TaxID=292 RepID=UPI002AB74476|nr:peroxiredoxin [Burkholderia cepacia]